VRLGTSGARAAGDVRAARASRGVARLGRGGRPGMRDTRERGRCEGEHSERAVARGVAQARAGWSGAPAAPGGTRERASAGLEQFAGGARAERGRRRAGDASVHAVERGSWRCGQVLGGRSRAGPWARAGRAGVRRAEQRHAQEELRWKAVAQDAGMRWPYRRCS
jgi:hypothetical protein